MPICPETACKGLTRPRILCALLLALLAFNPASAGWLDKLKEGLGAATPSTSALSAEQVGSGLKEALRVGTDTVVGNLGTPGGFNLDPEIRIPLPGQLDQVQGILAKVGMDSMLEDLEMRLNLAAELATPKAKALFIESIQDMTMDDVMAIYEGPDDAATTYLRGKMGGLLALEMKPVVDQSLDEAGAVKVYNEVMTRYNAVPLAPQVDADLNNYVTDKAMDGIFYYLAREEAAIRQDPAKRTTALLKQVFGGSG